jgi:hypothetical protein
MNANAGCTDKCLTSDPMAVRGAPFAVPFLISSKTLTRARAIAGGTLLVGMRGPMVSVFACRLPAWALLPFRFVWRRWGVLV